MDREYAIGTRVHGPAPLALGLAQLDKYLASLGLDSICCVQASAFRSRVVGASRLPGGERLRGWYVSYAGLIVAPQ